MVGRSRPPPAERPDAPAIKFPASAEFERIVRASLGLLGYSGTSTAAVISWSEHRGTFAGCPILDADDAETLNDAIQALHDRQEEDREAERVAETPVEPTRAYEPTHAERVFVASEGRCDLFSAARDRESLTPDERPVKARGVRRNNHVPSNRLPEDYEAQEVSEFGIIRRF